MSPLTADDNDGRQELKVQQYQSEEILFCRDVQSYQQLRFCFLFSKNLFGSLRESISSSKK